MSADAEFLPLDGLSEADKDALIARLWHDLQSERARAEALAARLADAPRGASEPDRLRRLQQAGARAAEAAPDGFRPRLGRGFRFVRSRGLTIAACVLALAFGLDFVIGRYQSYRLDQKRLADLEFQHAAFEGMFVEVESVACEPDQKFYRVRLKLTNIAGGRPLFVMLSPVRVFEQTGLAWQEVPSKDPEGQSARVIKLTDVYTLETVFEPNARDWTELIPGYMHIRFESDSLVSERSDPDDDIVDRRDRYYVYLKPRDADDDAIRKRMHIAGDPPIYMPMPPH